MRETPRRRRQDDDLHEGGGLPLFPLILVVILAGLLLGGVLAHFFGRSGGRPPTNTANAPAAIPSPELTPTPQANLAVVARPVRPTPAPRVTPKVTATTPQPTATPSVRSTREITSTPTPIAAATPTPHRVPKSAIAVATNATAASEHVPAPVAVHTAKPPPAPTPSAILASTQDNQASSVVRSYLNALVRGDRTAAAGYLARGAPGETFMDSSARIESIRSASTGPQQYKVTADVMTRSGEYFVTFTLEPGPAGLQITDHYSIKPQ